MVEENGAEQTTEDLAHDIYRWSAWDWHGRNLQRGKEECPMTDTASRQSK